MSKTFNKIILETEDKGTIIITPEHFYNIQDSDVKYVIIYSLKYINNDPSISEIETKIPYYISNGETNKLRANLLYPFMCYSKLSEINKCPFNINRLNSFNDDGTNGILLKYSIGNNIDIDYLESELINFFLQISPEKNSVEKMTGVLSAFKKSFPNGLTSIISRVRNLIDFIVCIISETIIHFNFTDEQHDILYNGKYEPLSEDDAIHFDYMDMSVLGEFCAISDFRRKFRLVILQILNEYCMLILNNELVRIEPIQLIMNNIDIAHFNNIVNICDTEKTKVNVKNYIIVSNSIIDLFIHKIEVSPTMTLLNKNKMNLAIRKLEKINENEIIMCNQLFKNWKANCVKDRFIPNTKDIFTMDKSEICKELKSYAQEDEQIKEQIIKLCESKEWGQITQSNLYKILEIARTEIFKKNIKTF